MGIFDIFKKKKFDVFEEDEAELEENKEPELEAEASFESRTEFKICKPKTFEQSLSAIDCLVAGRTVLLSLESIDRSLHRRVIDLVSGAAYALGFSIKKATNDSYIIAPKNIDVSGEIFETSDADEEFFTI
ncbi:MAG: cell division protein SepF [Clostridia bacterium]|nr:cell division protein SepF [Clostridia bacterium]